MGRYDDIINLPRPVSKRPAMAVADRAKIFMSFAALRGYEDAIAEMQKITTERIELSDERKEELDYQLQYLESRIAGGKIAKVIVCYFVVDEKVSGEENAELGKYVELEGEVTKVDRFNGWIRIGEEVILICDVLDICIANDSD